ncbi:NAD(P)/FAD-dependent oxidoreductase [Inconstantimicrobium porci]|uniref:NAD(P)/FAD-dependent oxidoreductase n=1 Tax=Inconstantimicrobium porci TaxID=2652291 RepID=A0A7X2MY28_9CLOT|nr:NAD(P)/FAD-dependent oxidoreductase [Inconstantimicrobium porci]MDD6771999.1 NAD(P)/FAD-dependent oxidoreductase [Inconstantimicrobium porci]MSR91165.1 NAD(P)/FAD-dependent oxidoreductase [Inconstantimicrobium porci]
MYDVAVIGAGVIGASIFRELTRYNVKTVIIEKENDVSMGTSKANSAIVHAGYDPENGTQMAKLNVEGSKMFEKICSELSVPYKKNGSLIIGFDDDDMQEINRLYENGTKNKVAGLKVLNSEEARKLEPNLSEDVKGALLAASGAIVGPFELTIALVENGLDNGGDIKLSAEVSKIEKTEKGFRISFKNGESVEAEYVINVAGLFADKIHNMIAEPSFEIHPRRGEYYVMDKSQGKLFSHTIFQCPSKKGKGVLVTPTVHGNLLVGPSSEDIDDVENMKTTLSGLDYVRKIAERTTKAINYREEIRNFSGLRAMSDRDDFIIEEAKDVPNFFDVAGIKSPGLSSAPAIAVHVVKMLQDKGLSHEENKSFNPVRKQTHFMELSEQEKDELIKKDSSFGRIICRCESITEGEILECIHRTLGATTVDGVKRRCRPGMGRCQGGFCGPRVQEILSRELNRDMTEIVQEKSGSYILTGKTK